jgi:alkanesulfonate monooxygenase SsuD/methylene tetrahydromethanopterin reductase-like flavin-dependent oxidoreductase (luciferase family)
MNQILFGTNVDPSAADPQEPFRRAQIADENGLDLITLMDHSYNRRLFDTWTLLTALAARTERVHVGTNVLNLSLRPPAMLAKVAASLDVLTGGRVEIGLGAGAGIGWDGVAAYGGPKRSPGEAYAAFEDALNIMRAMWDHTGGGVTYEGQVYQIHGLQPGPPPAHRIPLWVGGRGPRMLRLTGRLADGLFVSTAYDPRERLLTYNERIDEGAEQAGRSPTEIRRGYNLMGVLDLGRPDTRAKEEQANNIYGPVQKWVDEILTFYHDYGQDTFVFWPVAGNERLQIEGFAQEVVPAVRAALEE